MNSRTSLLNRTWRRKRPWSLSVVILLLYICAPTPAIPSDRSSCLYVYQRLWLPAGGYALLGVSMDALDDGAWNLERYLGDQLPAGSSVFLWDADEQAYGPEIRYDGEYWSEKDARLVRGQGFWLKCAPGGKDGGVWLALSGKAPTQETAEGADIQPMSDGHWYLLASPYPLATRLIDTPWARTASVGAKLIVWKAVEQKYGELKKTAVRRWDGETDSVLSPGQGVIFIPQPDGEKTWQEPAPNTGP